MSGSNRFGSYGNQNVHQKFLKQNGAQFRLRYLYSGVRCTCGTGLWSRHEFRGHLSPVATVYVFGCNEPFDHDRCQCVFSVVCLTNRRCRLLVCCNSFRHSAKFSSLLFEYITYERSVDIWQQNASRELQLLQPVTHFDYCFILSTTILHCVWCRCVSLNKLPTHVFGTGEIEL